MNASLSVTDERVSLRIRGRLDYRCWQVFREARVTAIERQLPIDVDVEACEGGDMGGLGALLLLQQKAGRVAIRGCNADFGRWFDVIGVCGACGGRAAGGVGCNQWSRETVPG